MRRLLTRKAVVSVLSVLLLLIIAGAVVGALVATHVIRIGSQSDSGTETGPDAGQTTSPSAPTGIPAPPTPCSTPDDIPSSAKGTFMDPTTWMDMTDFNCTFTSETVGDLPLVGLNASWDDSARANSQVPPLNKPWGSYTDRPIRGVNLGGWLSLEPFITPSLFRYDLNKKVVDEYSLCKHLGKDAQKTLEGHYSTFVTEQDFKHIAEAGLDHVRIPFSYWAVKIYSDDPYVLGTSWRYLLRGIEWARKYGLRVNLDPHAVPGSQNGWNHSGRQGSVGWLKGPDGKKNSDRSLEIHDQLSKFFAQDRYKNVVAFYGLVNEPANALSTDTLAEWTNNAYKLIRKNGVKAVQVFSEGLRGMDMWVGEVSNYDNTLAIDAHEYTIFDSGLIKMKHAEKIKFACSTFGEQIESSMSKSGFGPTMVGEWSQADTDCAEYLNGVGTGARWSGSFGGSSGPGCPTEDSKCDCDKANANPADFSAGYKRFLQTWAEAQMSAFEKSWGWFYWTWKTEAAYLWSYEAGLEGKILPAVAYEPEFNCSRSIPDFGDLPEYY